MGGPIVPLPCQGKTLGRRSLSLLLQPPRPCYAAWASHKGAHPRIERPSQAMHELQQHYQQLRCVLTNLVQMVREGSLTIRAEHELQRSQVYLTNHCAECGGAITHDDYAQIYRRECTRVGAAGIPSIEAQPLCPLCYAGRRRALRTFAPVLVAGQLASTEAQNPEAHAEIVVRLHVAPRPPRQDQSRHLRVGRARQPGAGYACVGHGHHISQQGKGGHAARGARLSKPRHRAAPLCQPHASGITTPGRFGRSRLSPFGGGSSLSSFTSM
jgi:hypothetical protein